MVVDRETFSLERSLLHSNHHLPGFYSLASATQIPPAPNWTHASGAGVERKRLGCVEGKRLLLRELEDLVRTKHSIH